MRIVLTMVSVLAAGCISEPSVAGPPDVGDPADFTRDQSVADIADGAADDLGADVAVVDAGPGVRATFESIALTASAGCAATIEGRVLCWGRNESRLLADSDVASLHPPNWRPDQFHLQSLNGGTDHICGIDDGVVRCWGATDNGEILPGAAPRGRPTAIPDLEKITPAAATTVSAGDRASCATFADEKVVCWGNSSIVTPGSVDLVEPATVIGGLAGEQVSTGIAHTCVIEPRRSLKCWGANDEGQAVPDAGDPVTAPIRVRGTRTYRDVDVADFTCGMFGAQVECWGANSDERLGVPDSGAQLATVPGLSDAIQVAVGATHACALRSSGAVVCWGDWGTGPGPPTEFRAPNGRPFTTVSAGSRVTCAATEAQLFCWGENRDGLAGQFDEGGMAVASEFDIPTAVPIPAPAE